MQDQGGQQPPTCEASAPTMEYSTWFTSGEWATEQDSVNALDDILVKLDTFTVYPYAGAGLRGVRGYYLQPRLGQALKKPCIDRVLVPKKKLLDRGWPYGPIGIECKASGVNIGPPLAQLLDYSRAAWEIKPGFWIVPEWTFLWPAPERLGGPLLSVFAQNRLGLASTGSYTALALTSGQNLANFSWNDTVRIGAGLNGAGRNGRKTGSR